MADTPSGPGEPAPPPRVEGIFRSGSITAIGVVLGFSLGFLSRWSALPGPWHISDLFAVAAITLGVAFQIWSLVDLLAVRSVIIVHYERAIRIFVAGLILAALGVFIAVFVEVFGGPGVIVLHG